MTYDLIFEERAKLHRLERFRVGVALTMFVMMCLDALMTLVWQFPAMAVLVPYLAVNLTLALMLHWCGRAIAARRRLYFGLLQQKYEDVRH